MSDAARRLPWLLLLCGSGACDQCVPQPSAQWELLHDGDPGALLSVRAAAGSVWVSGGDPDGPEGPATGTLLVDDDPSDEEDFIALDTGLQSDLWWVSPVDANLAWVGGSDGLVARVERSGSEVTVTELTTPVADDADDNLIVFGVLAVGEEVWAVGGQIGGISGGFLWRSQGGEALADVAVPTSLDDFVLWKAAARAPDDVWFVGTHGLTLHWDGATLTELLAGDDASLFTVSVDDAGAVAVGRAGGQGRLLSRGLDNGAPWDDVTPAGGTLPAMFGVHVLGGEGLVVGDSGTVLVREDGGWARQELGFPMFVTLHSCLLGEDGDAFAVGGSLTTLPLRGGVLLRRTP